MKKIIYILPLLFTVLVSSCEVENGESGYPKTLQGIAAYEIVENSLYESISLLDLMTEVDLYAQAPVDEKEGIKNYFLPEYSIVNIENAWVLKKDFQEIIFTHNQKSLNEKGAVWTAKISGKTYEGKTVTIIENKNFRVETLGNNDWKVIASDLKSFNPGSDYIYSSGHVSNYELFIGGVKAYDKSPNLYDFNINRGTGDTNTGATLFNYQILLPLSYTDIGSHFSGYYPKFSPISGKLDITVDKNKISIEISKSNVQVTMNGITDIY